MQLTRRLKDSGSLHHNKMNLLFRTNEEFAKVLMSTAALSAIEIMSIATLTSIVGFEAVAASTISLVAVTAVIGFNLLTKY